MVSGGHPILDRIPWVFIYPSLCKVNFRNLDAIGKITKLSEKNWTRIYR